jgi:hypothetical protein
MRPGHLIAIGATLGICMVLAGCMTDNSAASDNADCISYGAKPGTEAYFQCRMAKDQQRKAILGSLAGAMIVNQPQPYYLPQPH